MKWRNVSTRLWKKFLVVLVITSVQIVTNKVNFERHRFPSNEVTNKTLVQVRRDLQKLDDASISSSDVINDNVGDDVRVDRRVCKPSIADEKYVDEVTFIVDPEKRLGYCHVPKVASSSWMAAFASMYNFDPLDYLKNLDSNTTEILLDEEDFSTKNMTHEVIEILRQVIQKLKHNETVETSKNDIQEALIERGFFHSIIINNYSLKMKLKEGEQNPEFFNSLFKFIFVRHPFERLVSAYFDKFVRKRDPNFIRSFIYYETPPDLLIKASINKYLFKKSTFSNFRITFEKFVKFVIHEIRNKLVSYGTFHWMPFTDFCGVCSVRYDFVGQIETLESDFYHLGQLFPELSGLKDIFRSKMNSVAGRGHKTSLSAFSKLPKTLIKELYQVYEADFIFGGYPYPQEYIDLGRAS